MEDKIVVQILEENITTFILQTLLQGVRIFKLATNDAHSLYSQYGFEQNVNPELFMQKVLKNPY